MAQPSTLNRNQPNNDIWQNLGNSLKNLAQKLWPFLKYEDRVQAVVTLDYNLSYIRSANTFELLFGDPSVWNIPIGTLATGPNSPSINPATGNSYANDYNNRLIQIQRGTRLNWQDNDTSKYFDWQYTFVNPVTTLDQVWVGGTLLSQSTAPAWNPSTTYPAGNRVVFANFIWVCTTANTNQQPITPSSYWQNTGIPYNSGYPATGTCNVPQNLSLYAFNYYATPNPLTVPSQYAFQGGTGASGVYGINGLWNKSSYYQYSGIPGKMPVVTLNTFMIPSNSNRYPTPFNVQHQMDMLDFINTGLGNPNLQKVDHIQLGANMFNAGVVNGGVPVPYSVFPNVAANNCFPYGGNSAVSGWNYGGAMVDYVSAIRGNSEPITANAKIIIEAPKKVIGTPLLYQNFMYNYGNLNDTTIGFLHGFYDSTNNPTNEDFDIISIRLYPWIGTQVWNNSNTTNPSINNGYDAVMAQTISATTTNDMPDYINVLTRYGKQNRVKFWIHNDMRYPAGYFYNAPVSAPYSADWATYSWSTGTSHIGSLIVAATDPRIAGYKWGKILDYKYPIGGVGTGLVYTATDTFGPNTTRVADYTSVGHMFNVLLADRLNPALGALKYTRINAVTGTWPNTASSHGTFGIYIESDGSNYSKHTILIVNWSAKDSDFLNLDLTQLIGPSWTNIQFQKIFTIGSQYDPVNYFITPGTFIEIQQDTPYTPTSAQISNTQLYPTEYLIITAD